ncbi:ABC transporter ATP-binding protein [Nocardioides sp. KR10-350]|uniref:ABC transporter ATP-binding protein n=1 Tax=Nocardioides cheoyonin TaxID=3156615 RepID=UPI0032B45DD1
MDTRPAVRARGITKDFGDVVALDEVDLDVDPGEIHGLVGPNGAGKTTLLGLLLGLALPDDGTLEILGQPVGRVLSVPEGVAGFVDGPGLYPALTGRQNLLALASLRGYGPERTQEVDAALEEVGLSGVADGRMRGFSLGMRQRLGLAAALLTHPRLLVLDEPSNGLDLAGKRHVHRVLQRLADEGTAVVMSSHRMDDLAALCTQVTILSVGRTVFSGPVDKLAAESGDLDYRIQVSDHESASAIAAGSPGIQLVPPSSGSLRPQADAVVVHGPVPALDELVSRLVGGGVAVRELAPVVPPLEAAFLALTGLDGSAAQDEEGAR